MNIQFPWTDQTTIPDKYGDNAEKFDKWHGMNIRSFGFGVTGLPDHTKSIAFALIDYDTIPRLGFPFYHWVVANVPTSTSGKVAVVVDGASLEMLYTRGANSLDSKILKKRHPLLTKSAEYALAAAGYRGPSPIPKGSTHSYTLQVWALDDFLDLSTGFYYNELRDLAKGHILGSLESILTYTSK